MYEYLLVSIDVRLQSVFGLDLYLLVRVQKVFLLLFGFNKNHAYNMPRERILVVDFQTIVQ